MKNSGIFVLDEAKELIAEGYPITMHKKNVGNEHITAVIEKVGISKYLCGHIHEAGGKALTKKGKLIQENAWSNELFYNCSSGKEGRAGIAEFEGNKAKYRNVSA